MRKERGRVRRSGEKGGRFPVPKRAWAPHHHARLASGITSWNRPR